MSTSAVTENQLGSIYLVHYRSLVRLAALLLDETAAAEDVVQEAFLRVAAGGRLARLRDPDAALAYIRTTVLNLARSSLRRRLVATRYAPLVHRRDRVDDATVAAVDRATVVAALRQLPTAAAGGGGAALLRGSLRGCDRRADGREHRSRQVLHVARSRPPRRAVGGEPMNALDEAGIRAELHQALDVLDPLPPPFAAVIAKSRRRRRTRLVVGGLAWPRQRRPRWSRSSSSRRVAGPRRSDRLPPPRFAPTRDNGGVPVKHSPDSLDWVAGPVKTRPAATAPSSPSATSSWSSGEGQWQTEAKVALGEGPAVVPAWAAGGPDAAVGDSRRSSPAVKAATSATSVQ